MNKKTVSVSLPQIDRMELKNATIDWENGVISGEYGQEDIGKDAYEIAVDFERARNYLDQGLHQPRFYTTEKHLPKLEALNQLIILAAARNALDEFKPDWENRNQYKHSPLFKFINGKFEFSDVGAVKVFADTHSSNFSFKTPERAEQFGKQFIDLFRIVLTN